MEDFSDFLDLLKALKTKLYNPDKTDTAQYSSYREPCGLCGPYKEACEVNRTVMGIKKPQRYPLSVPYVQLHRATISQRVYFSLFIFNRRLEHSGTANHRHSRYQNNMAAQQMGALPSVLIYPHHRHHHFPLGYDAIFPKWKQKSRR